MNSRTTFKISLYCQIWEIAHLYVATTKLYVFLIESLTLRFYFSINVLDSSHKIPYIHALTSTTPLKKSKFHDFTVQRITVTNISTTIKNIHSLPWKHNLYKCFIPWLSNIPLSSLKSQNTLLLLTSHLCRQSLLLNCCVIAHSKTKTIYIAVHFYSKNEPVIAWWHEHIKILIFTIFHIIQLNMEP